MFTIKLETRSLEALENELDKFGAHTAPFAIRDTLNNLAFKTADLARRNVKRLFVLRNQYTVRSIQVEKTRSRRIADMESKAGSIQKYLKKQEEGFVERKTGKHGVAIPTGEAAGQYGASKRTKLVKRINWLSRLKVSKIRGNASTRKATIIVAARRAIRTGRRVVFLELRKKGLYRVVGGRKGGSGWPKGAKLKMLYSLDKSSITVQARPWLAPAARLMGHKIGDVYKEALIRQIRINRQFRDR